MRQNIIILLTLLTFNSFAFSEIECSCHEQESVSVLLSAPHVLKCSGSIDDDQSIDFDNDSENTIFTGLHNKFNCKKAAKQMKKYGAFCNWGTLSLHLFELNSDGKGVTEIKSFTRGFLFGGYSLDGAEDACRKSLEELYGE